ncbi:hypothetical protein E2C01_018947 [Portunus trituberculatus]|uniref:Uncharacterized protein n=1 Tax=Portunus trituberculatus TaxID=210409 RepID=A0A5B7DYG9_PORTR|nr:hypothetical protein [Portunus trituberculatus]
MFTFSSGCAALPRGHISQLLSNSPSKHGPKRVITQPLHRSNGTASDTPRLDVYSSFNGRALGGDERRASPNSHVWTRAGVILGGRHATHSLSKSSMSAGPDMHGSHPGHTAATGSASLLRGSARGTGWGRCAIQGHHCTVASPPGPRDPDLHDWQACKGGGSSWLLSPRPALTTSDWPVWRGLETMHSETRLAYRPLLYRPLWPRTPPLAHTHHLHVSNQPPFIQTPYLKQKVIINHHPATFVVPKHPSQPLPSITALHCPFTTVITIHHRAHHRTTSAPSAPINQGR